MTEREWEAEPDELDFEAHGLPCHMTRGPGGNWCGYVGVIKGHPLHGKGYSNLIYDPPKHLIERRVDVDKVGAINLFCATVKGDDITKACELVLLIDVHGGLTYAADRKPGQRPDGLWWFGFDCAHAGDFSPRHEGEHWRTEHGCVYRNMAYVRHECEELARQMAEWPA